MINFVRIHPFNDGSGDGGVLTNSYGWNCLSDVLMIRVYLMSYVCGDDACGDVCGDVSDGAYVHACARVCVHVCAHVCDACARASCDDVYAFDGDVLTNSYVWNCLSVVLTNDVYNASLIS
jgi:hypothetical protein